MKKHIFIIALGLGSILQAQTEGASYNTEKLDTYFKQIFPADEPGGAVLIMKGDEIVFSNGYGLADMKLKTKIDVNTVFNTGSISKTFVSNAILILAEDGKLSLDDPLSMYFSNFKNKEIADKVQIKHLLNHSSGLMDTRKTEREAEFYLTAKDAENWYPITQNEQLSFEPGAQFQYSNPAYNGLALIIEQVSGMKWQSFVKERIYTLAGMSTSTITDGAEPKSGVAHAYVKTNQVWEESDYGEVPTFAAAGNGGIWSSVTELAKYQQALMSEKIISTELFDESREIKQWPNWKSDEPPYIGWSWFISQTSDGLKTVGHTGSQGGFRANFVTIPEKELIFVLLTNTPRDMFGMEAFVMEWLRKFE